LVLASTIGVSIAFLWANRFHVKHFIFFLLFSSLALVGFGQQVYYTQSNTMVFPAKDTSVWNKLNRHAYFKKLSMEEKEVFYYTNLVRLRPKFFVDSVLQKFVQLYPNMKGGNFNSLQKELLAYVPVSRLMLPDSAMMRLSRGHAKDMGKTGQYGHSGSNGESFEERMARGKYYSCLGENINVGAYTAGEAVIHLLIDKGVSNLGHRKNILSKEYNFMGVGVDSYQGKTSITVQDFLCEQ
jgi:hypothetical protein